MLDAHPPLPADHAQPTQALGVRLRLLGQPVLLGPAGQRPLERRDAALLTWLAWHGPAARHALAAAIWPDSEPALALSSLRQRLFRLRRSAGVDLVLGTAHLRLHPSLAHDLAPGVLVPDVLVPITPEAPQTPPSPNAALLAGLDYGDLPELDERVQAWRMRWQTEALARQAAHAEALERQGRLAPALDWARSVVHAQPLSEHAHRRVMRLHYTRGDRAAALAAYQVCRQALQQGLGLEPGDETRELAALIESSSLAPVSALTAPAGTSGAGAGAGPTRPAVAVAVSLRRPPSLIGRDNEWAQLLHAHSALQAVLLEGEPGIGKTRLGTDFALHVGRVLAWKAHPAQARVPYAVLSAQLQAWPLDWALLPPWAAAELARLAPMRAQPAPGRLEPAALAAALALALGQLAEVDAQARPLTLLVDDLQWLDAATLECLLAALPGLAAQGIWTLFTLRLGEPVPEALQRWHLPSSDPGLPAWQRLVLGPLAAADVPAFIASLDLPAAAGVKPKDLSQLAATLWRRCGGRPLYMLELLRGQGSATAQGAADAPATALLDMVQARVQALGPAALRLLRVAALLAEWFSPGRAAAVLNQHVLDLAEPLAELQTAQLLDGEGFPFDLVQEAALRSVPAALAPAMHGLVAQALAADAVPPSHVARHWQAARRWSRAALAFEAAARLAHGAARRAEELHFLDQAAHAHEQAGGESTDAPAATAGRAATRAAADAAARAAAFDCRCQAARVALFVDEAAAAQQRVHTLVALAGYPAERLRALVLQARAAHVMSAPAAALAPAHEALALAGQLADQAAALQAAGYLGMAQVLTGAAVAGLALLQGGQAQLELLQAQSPTALPDIAKRDFVGARGYALCVAGRWAEALTPLLQAADLSVAAGDLSDAMDHLANASIAQARSGQRDAELASLERLHGLWRGMNQPGGVGHASALMHVATTYSSRDRLAEALTLQEWVLGEFVRGGAAVWELLTRHRLCRLYFRMGQFARAQQQLTPLPESADTGQRLSRLRMQALLDDAAGRSPWPRLLAAETSLAAGLHADADPTDRWMFALALAQFAEPEESLQRSHRLLADVGHDNLPLRLHAGIRCADALRRAGQGQRAAQMVRGLLPLQAQAEPLDMDPLDFGWLACQALRAGGDALADELARALQQRIAAMLPQVPPSFRASFVERNAAVRGALAWQFAC